jgi:putative transcriptional regulator
MFMQLSAPRLGQNVDMERRAPSTRRRLLVAAPPLDDPNFDRTVVFVLEHDSAGAVGLVINRPTRRTVGAGIEPWLAHSDAPRVVFGGGPVEPHVLIAIALTRVDDDSASDIDTIDLTDDPDLAAGELRHLRIYSGYSGWGPGQLDDEIAAGAWLVVDAEIDDVFDVEPTAAWRRVLARQGGRMALLATAPDDLSMN